jgi:hypothetical protein
MILAPAIAVLAAQGISDGFRPYEKSLLAALWLVPILARGVAFATLIPVGVFLLLATLTFLAVCEFRDKAMFPYKTRSRRTDAVHRSAEPVRP